MSELRYNPIDGNNVILAEQRSGRPFVKKVNESIANESDNHDCPFCEGNEKLTPPELYSIRNNSKPDEPGWKVRVIPNKYPIVDQSAETRELQNQELFCSGVVKGYHEVLIETPFHSKCLHELHQEEVANVLCVYRERARTLSAIQGIAYVSIFKNRGEHAGASLPHPHSQIIATNIVPDLVKRRLENLYNYYCSKKNCMICDIVKDEIKSDQRVAFKSRRFVILLPFWSASPFETLIIPIKHESRFELTTDSEIADLADTLKLYLCALESLSGSVPYNLMLNMLPSEEHVMTVDDSEVPAFHWYFKIVPRITKTAGYELHTGLYVNSLSPENAKTILKREFKSII